MEDLTSWSAIQSRIFGSHAPSEFNVNANFLQVVATLMMSSAVNEDVILNIISSGMSFAKFRGTESDSMASLINFTVFQ